MEMAVRGPSDDDELTVLANRVRGGNAAAFEELARRVRGRVHRWAVRLVVDRDEAEDVAQLVLVRLHERIAEFEGRSRFGSWLYRITLNLALDRRRADARRRALLATSLTSASGEVDASAAIDAGDTARISRLV